MDSLHSHFGLIAPGREKLTLAASQYRTRFCIDKKFGNSTLGQPPTTISGHSGYFRWLALDGNLAWPRERWATILTCVDEGSAIHCHLLVVATKSLEDGSRIFWKIRPGYGLKDRLHVGDSLYPIGVLARPIET